VCNVEGERTRRTRTVIGRRRTSPPLLCVCVCVIITTYAAVTRTLWRRRRSRHSRGFVSILEVARPTGFPRFICLFFPPPNTVVWYIHVIVVLGPMKICSLKIWYIITSTVHHRVVIVPINNRYNRYSTDTVAVSSYVICVLLFECIFRSYFWTQPCFSSNS